MKKRMFIMLAAVLLVVATIAFIKYQGIKQQMAAGAMMMSMPSTVSTLKVTSAEWVDHKQAVGTIRAVKGVDIASEVTGIVQEINFTSGQDVKEGDVLLRIRADEDIAKLQTLEANLKLAEINLGRSRKQFAVQAVSQAEIDNSTAALAVARAAINEQKALVDKKIIRAPFSGKLGIRAVDLGQYVNPGAPIVTLQALDSVYFDFAMPQQDVSELKAGQKVDVKTDAHPGRSFVGEIIAVNSKVETSTRNVYVRASIDNKDHALLPGMFANADISVGTPKKALTLPQTAVTYNPFGTTVYVVDETKEEGSDEPKLIARQVFITTGETRGDQVAVLPSEKEGEGIKEGDTIVASGQVKIHNGSHLAIDNSKATTNDPNPQPEDK